MSYLDQVQVGNPQEGQRIVIYGKEKVGKSTLCCSAPNALLIPLEMGYSSIPSPRLPMLQTWPEVEKLCLDLRQGYQSGRIARGSSVVWDSGTALERIIHNYTIATDPDLLRGKWQNKDSAPNMEIVHGGYGKAYQIANSLFETWTRYMDELAKFGGINVIVSCHGFAARVVDPGFGEYDTWDLLLHSPKNQKNYGKRELMTQWADMVGYMHEPMFVSKAEKGQSLIRGIDGNQGVMLAVDRTPGWVAGNRYHLTGLVPMTKPEPGRLSIQAWNNLAWGIYNNTGIDLFNRT